MLDCRSGENDLWKTTAKTWSYCALRFRLLQDLQIAVMAEMTLRGLSTGSGGIPNEMKETNKFSNVLSKL